MLGSLYCVRVAVVIAFLSASAAMGCDRGASAKHDPVASAARSSASTTAAIPGASSSASALVIEGRRIDIVADEKGFTPSTVNVKKGETTTLVFTRTSKNTCADAVMFPELKIDKMLPLNTAVAIIVPVDQAHTYAFQCGMGMYKSKVLVE